MPKLKLLIFFIPIILSSCSSSNTREYYANEENTITLQEPKTRVLVKCYPNEYQPAEFCAHLFEEKGYVRLKDIPRQPAKYDFLKRNTYPTRRWRDGETTARW